MEQHRHCHTADTFTLVANDPCDSSRKHAACLRKEVDELCIVLFDRWCERRAITPLIYLLYAWPLMSSAPHTARAVSRTLDELSRFHSEALDDKERQLIARVKALTG